MNLGRALARVPRHLLSDAPQGHSTGVRHEATGPKGVPAEIIRQAGLIYVIGQITRPVSWVALAGWVGRKAGVSITAKGTSMRVAHLLEDRILPKNEERNALCAAYYIVCRAYGIKQPWQHIAERLLAVRGINKLPNRLNMDTVVWMRRQLEKAER